ncbi:MAG: proliferating cell nuclear antigen (pcna) [Desulfurococcales archaeon ex4484_217_1]|nr:MAG: proliferating cell nuclear antigen (pcna) [Desulfurococcales archaeon ex4484_217_1]
MSKVLFSDARAWRYLMTAIGKIIEEGTLRFTSEGVTLRAMDPSHIIMVDLNMPKTIFEEYNVTKEEKVSINFNDFIKILRRATKNDKLGLELREEKIAVVFLGASERTFVLPTLSISEEKLPEPRIQFKASVRITSATFRDMLKDIEPVAETIKLVCDGEALKVIGKGSRGEAEIVLTEESGALIDLSVEEKAEASYSIEYFKNIAPASQASDTVTIRFSTNMPCRLDFELAGEGRLTFYIAPRVD